MPWVSSLFFFPSSICRWLIGQMGSHNYSNFLSPSHPGQHPPNGWIDSIHSGRARSAPHQKKLVCAKLQVNCIFNVKQQLTNTSNLHGRKQRTTFYPWITASFHWGRKNEITKDLLGSRHIACSPPINWGYRSFEAPRPDPLKSLASHFINRNFLSV